MIAGQYGGKRGDVFIYRNSTCWGVYTRGMEGAGEEGICVDIQNKPGSRQKQREKLRLAADGHTHSYIPQTEKKKT